MNLSLGATLIIAGTTIGAGMLALPLASAPLGFPLTMALMFFWWLVMLYSAELFVRLNRVYGEPASLPLLFRHYGSKKMEAFLSFVLCFLFFALVAAYLTGGASVLHNLLADEIKAKISHSSVITLFTLVFSFLILSQRHFSDAVNRFLVAVKVVAFILMYIQLWPLIKSEHLLETHISLQNQTSLWVAIPIVFTSFGFHGSISSILKYVGIQNRSVIKILFWGSFLPCLIYLLWIVASVGSIPFEGPQSFTTIQENGNDVGVLLNILSRLSQSPSLLIASSVFSLLAIATSLLGVGLGLFDFFEERMSGSLRTFKSIFATFFIPFLFAQFYPNGFILALGFAAMALSFLAVIFPAYLCLKLGENFPLHFRYERFFIFLVMLLGLSIVGMELIHLF